MATLQQSHGGEIRGGGKLLTMSTWMKSQEAVQTTQAALAAAPVKAAETPVGAILVDETDISIIPADSNINSCDGGGGGDVEMF